MGEKIKIEATEYFPTDLDSPIVVKAEQFEGFASTSNNPIIIKIEAPNLPPGMANYNSNHNVLDDINYSSLESSKTYNHYYCELCQKKFTSKYYLKNHKERKHSNGNFRCEYCQKFFSSRLQKITHEARHGLAMEYSCHFCEKQFKTPREMRSHENHRHGKFKCSSCEEIFDSMDKLNNHSQLHKNSGASLRCEHCLETFSFDVSLKKHIEQKHLQPKKLFKCKFCSKCFTDPDSTANHEATHLTFQTHICFQCEGVAFIMKSDLDNHMRHVHGIESN